MTKFFTKKCEVDVILPDSKFTDEVVEKNLDYEIGKDNIESYKVFNGKKYYSKWSKVKM